VIYGRGKMDGTRTQLREFALEREDSYCSPPAWRREEYYAAICSDNLEREIAGIAISDSPLGYVKRVFVNWMGYAEDLYVRPTFTGAYILKRLRDVHSFNAAARVNTTYSIDEYIDAYPALQENEQPYWLDKNRRFMNGVVAAGRIRVRHILSFATVLVGIGALCYVSILLLFLGKKKVIDPRILVISLYSSILFGSQVMMAMAHYSLSRYASTYEVFGWLMLLGPVALFMHYSFGFVVKLVK